MKQQDQVLKVLFTSSLNPLAPVFQPRSVAVVNTTKPDNVEAPTNHLSIEPETTKERIKRLAISNINQLPEEILLRIFQFLRKADLRACQKVCRLWERISSDITFWERVELICFHTKISFEEDILGIGVTLQMNPRTKKIQYVNAELDLISKIAFFDLGIKTSVWKEPLSHWLPLYINKQHGKSALPLLKKSLAVIYEKPFHPEMTIDLFSKLMNTMIVKVMSGELHASINALQGYMYFHRWLIAFVEEYPDLLDEINDRVKRFITREDERHKDKCPSLGDFLPLLSISKYRWSSLAIAVVKENLTRNVLWIIKANPQLGKINTEYDVVIERNRTTKSFESTRTSQRLLMFHVYFLNNVANAGTISLHDLSYQYDARFGCATPRMQEELQKEVFKIQSINCYEDYFKYVGLPIPSERTLHELILSSFEASLIKGYHREGTGRGRGERKKEKIPQDKKLRPTTDWE